MPLYYLDPEREPRDCPGCIDCVTCCDECRWKVVGNPECHGTGRLGVERAEADVDVHWERNEWTGEVCWLWKKAGDPCDTRIQRNCHGPYPTEADALAAARAAHRRER